MLPAPPLFPCPITLVPAVLPSAAPPPLPPFPAETPSFEEPPPPPIAVNDKAELLLPFLPSGNNDVPPAPPFPTTTEYDPVFAFKVPVNKPPPPPPPP